MSSLTTSQTPRRIAAAGMRAKDAATQGAQGAREWAAPRLEDAADAITRAKDAATQGVHDAREWAAPRLEDAANAVTESVAPRVSAALRSTARQVKPEVVRKDWPTQAAELALAAWRGSGDRRGRRVGGCDATALRQRHG